MSGVAIMSERTMAHVAQALCDAIDAGGGQGYLEFLDSPSARANVLAVARFAYPCAERVTGELIDFRPCVGDREVTVGGSAVWARAKDSNGNLVFECDVGHEGDKSNPACFVEDRFIRRGGLIFVKSFRLCFRQTKENSR